MKLVEPRPAKLDSVQVNTQRLIGSLKYISLLHPRFSLALHRLSCVMSAPPHVAYEVAKAVLAEAYAERDIGITYGGSCHASSPRLGGALTAQIDLSEPAPTMLETHADATWGERQVFGTLATYAGGAVYHNTQKISLIVDSSMEAEAHATGKGGELVCYARTVLRALGVPQLTPTLLGTDNLANQRIGSSIGCPARSKHFLRRYMVLQQRVADKEIETCGMSWTPTCRPTS